MTWIKEQPYAQGRKTLRPTTNFCSSDVTVFPDGIVSGIIPSIVDEVILVLCCLTLRVHASYISLLVLDRWCLICSFITAGNPKSKQLRFRILLTTICIAITWKSACVLCPVLFLLQNCFNFSPQRKLTIRIKVSGRIHNSSRCEHFSFSFFHKF